MGRIGVCIALGLALAVIARANAPEVARLQAPIERLQAENKALREALKGDADARAGFARLGLDSRLLHHLEVAMREKPNDRSLRPAPRRGRHRPRCVRRGGSACRIEERRPCWSSTRAV